MKQKPPKTIGFVLKHHIDKANDVAERVATWLIQRKYNLVVSNDAVKFSKKFKKIKTVVKEQLPEICDIILIFGGDGTFLSIARHMKKKSVPVLGINLGRLGFLTEISVDQVFQELEQILAGRFTIQERTMLEVSIQRNGKIIFSCPALNDAVITNKKIARIIDLQVKIDRISAAVIKADGLIISTPTGSTAYSLAAGGPIVHPDVSATTIIAICPHSLTIRPIVVPDSSVIEVNIIDEADATLLTIDGQIGYDLLPRDTIHIQKYTKHKLKMIRTKQNYFELLRNKLKLGARGEEN